jgi:integrase
MTTESKELALNDREFELFIRGARRLDCELQSQEAVFIGFVGGRLGLRPGEICHICEDWIDWRERMIVIPRHDECTKGKDGGLCGSCWQSVRQRVEHAEMTLEEARLEVLQDVLGAKLPGHIQSQIRASHFAAIEGQLDAASLERQLEEILDSADAVGGRDELLDALNTAARELMADEVISKEEAAEEMWTPKSEEGARKVPFDFSARAELVVEEFFDRFSNWPESQSTINRRVDKVLENVDEFSVDTTTPHGLRATAASSAVSHGLGPLALQSMFGWADISTARNYVAASPENTQRQLHQIYST